MVGKVKKKVDQKADYVRALRFMWQFVAPVYKPVWWVVFFLLISIGIGLIEPHVYRLTVDALTGAKNLDFVYILKLLGVWGGLGLVNLMAFSLYRLIIAYRFSKVDAIYYKKAFEVFFNLDIARHLSKKAGEQLKKIDKANDAIWGICLLLSDEIIHSWLMSLAMLVMAFYFSWQMALVTIAMVPVYLLIFGYANSKTGWLQDEIMKEYESFWGKAQDLATNIMSVKSYARENFHLTSMDKKIIGIADKQSKISVRWAALNTAGHLLGIFNRLVIFAGGVYLMSIGVVSLGTIIMFLSMSGAIYAPLHSFGYQLRNFQKNVISLNEVQRIFEELNKINDQDDADDLVVKNGKIEFRKVSFQYEKVGILKKVSFEVRPGQMVALVGHSGAGKSTIASLVSRFYDVTEGAILIDGQDLRAVTQRSLRENIGLVMQDNSMFNDTIYNNILYARPGAKKAEVIAAARAANIDEFIMSQPKKYQTLVGERGLKLSGGQKQRVAIARVILKNPPILILDEATSALDSASEKVVQEALEKVMKGRTSIVIAHRLSTVRKADQIVVLDKGRVVQQGNHAELIKQKGIYRDLVDLQVNGLLAK
jgi:ABC-type multidrug transport system fused ATPase/permease subunit